MRGAEETIAAGVDNSNLKAAEVEVHCSHTLHTKMKQKAQAQAVVVGASAKLVEGEGNATNEIENENSR